MSHTLWSFYSCWYLVKQFFIGVTESVYFKSSSFWYCKVDIWCFFLKLLLCIKINIYIWNILFCNEHVLGINYYINMNIFHQSILHVLPILLMHVYMKNITNFKLLCTFKIRTRSLSLGVVDFSCENIFRASLAAESI